MLVGYFVFEELSELVSDHRKLSKRLDKFKMRYPEDVEFKVLCELHAKYLSSYDPKVLEEFTSSLEKIKAARMHQSGGGGGLPFSDRRRMREDRNRR